MYECQRYFMLKQNNSNLTQMYLFIDFNCVLLRMDNHFANLTSDQ